MEQAIVWLDVVIVGALAGPAAAGVYGAASRFIAAGLVVDAAIRVVVAPRFSALLHLGRTEDVQALYRVAATWLVLFAAPAYLILAVYAPTVLSWLGPGFSAGSTALLVLCAGAILTFMAGNIHSVLLMSGRSGWAAFNKAVVLVLNVVGNVILVPRMGIVGAALSWAVSMLADAVLATIQVRLLVGVRSDLAGVTRALGIAVLTVGVPAVLIRQVLDPGMVGLVVSAVIGLSLLAGACVRWRRALHLDELGPQLLRRR